MPRRHPRPQLHRQISVLRAVLIRLYSRATRNGFWIIEITGTTFKIYFFICKISSYLINRAFIYRSIIAAFINAGNLMESSRLEEATPFYCVACEYNERITSYLKDKWKGMDHEFLVANRRKCLKLWNQVSIRKFVQNQLQQSSNPAAAAAVASSPVHHPSGGNALLSQQELNGLFETMINKFLPCFFRLATSTNEDKHLIEEIRQEWLQVLDSNLPGLLS